LQSIVTVLHAHDFPVTSLKFNPSGTLVVSGSADNTVRVIDIPAVAARGSSCSASCEAGVCCSHRLACFVSRSSGGNSALWNVFITLLILVLAILIQRSFGDDLLRAAGSLLH
jgi:prolactin regulatory element-binding protein